MQWFNNGTTKNPVIGWSKRLVKLLFCSAAGQSRKVKYAGNVMLKAVLFDVIGTTVTEKNGSTVMDAFEKAFLKYVNSIDREILKQNRGKDKRVMIKAVLTHHAYPLSLIEPVYQAFRQNFVEALDNFSESNGAGEMFIYLKQQGIRLGIGTGLDKELFSMICQRLGWKSCHFDYIGTAGSSVAGRPQPDMIFDMMRKLNISSKESFLKVGDTVADILEGKNAGVITAAVCSGSQSKEDLAKEHPDFIINSLPELKPLFAG